MHRDLKILIGWMVQQLRLKILSCWLVQCLHRLPQLSKVLLLCHTNKIYSSQNDKKALSEVGFEPTPPIGDQNTRTLMQRKLDLSLAP